MVNLVYLFVTLKRYNAIIPAVSILWQSPTVTAATALNWPHEKSPNVEKQMHFNLWKITKLEQLSLALFHSYKILIIQEISSKIRTI